MIIEKHPTNEEAEQVYDFYELEDVELADGTSGQVKKKVESIKKSQLQTRKEEYEAKIVEINNKIAGIEELE